LLNRFAIRKTRRAVREEKIAKGNRTAKAFIPNARTDRSRRERASGDW
jgi:hypothetical protein